MYVEAPRVSPAFLEGKYSMFVFERKDISKYIKFAFSGQMSLRGIAESLKIAPVFLNRCESFWQLALI